MLHASVPQALHERGIVAVEFFGGIWGLRMSLDRLGAHAVCAGYAETNKTARGVYRRNWPGDMDGGRRRGRWEETARGPAPSLP